MVFQILWDSCRDQRLLKKWSSYVESLYSFCHLPWGLAAVQYILVIVLMALE